MGLVLALPDEARRVPDDLGRVVCSGVGPERARVAAEQLICDGASLLVSAGVAAGLRADAGTGAVMIPDSVYWQGQTLMTEPALSGRLRDALVGEMHVMRGVHYAAEQMVLSPVEKRTIATHSGAGTLDMESGAVVAAAHASQTPVIVVRAVCDPVSTRITPLVGELLGGNGTVAVRDVLRLLAVRPYLLPEFINLGWRFSGALRSLSTALAALRRLRCEEHVG